jgi:hypothetical protein
MEESMSDDKSLGELIEEFRRLLPWFNELNFSSFSVGDVIHLMRIAELGWHEEYLEQHAGYIDGELRELVPYMKQKVESVPWVGFGDGHAPFTA